MAVTRKYKVKIRPLKVELEVDDFDKENEESRKVKMMAIEVKWKGESKFGLVQFYKYKKDFTSRRFMKDNCVKWDNDEDEFENVCCFTENQSLKKYSAWDVTFNVLYATNFQKMMLIGKVVVNVAELGARRMCVVEEKVPITLNIGKTSISAMLHVNITFGEMKDWVESRQLKWLSKSSSVCERKLDESSTFEAEVPKGSSQTQPDLVKKVGWFSWKRRRLSREEALINRSCSFGVDSPLNQQVHLRKHTKDSVLYYVSICLI